MSKGDLSRTSQPSPTFGERSIFGWWKPLPWSPPEACRCFVTCSLGDLVPSLTEVVLTADNMGVRNVAQASVALTFPLFEPEPTGGERALFLEGPLPSSISLTFEDQEPLYNLTLRDVDANFTINASPSLVPVERLDWWGTVPADLAVLQQFGRPSVHVNFILTTEEAYPVIADYVAWLREEAPETKIGLSDEEGNPLELSDVGVSE